MREGEGAVCTARDPEAFVACLLGSRENVTCWYLDAPPDWLVKRAGRCYYERNTAPVSARRVLNFDQDLLRRIGGGWVLPSVERMAGGEPRTLGAALAAALVAGCASTSGPDASQNVPPGMKVVCTKEKPTGSNIAKKVCWTVKDTDTARRESQSYVREIQRGSGIGGGEP